MPHHPPLTKTVAVLKELVRDTTATSGELLKITVPAVIATKILEELGLIVYISMALEPVMGLMGLPGALGLVWATGIMTSLYGVVGVYAALAPGLELTSAQVTVLCSVILIAHSLPVETAADRRDPSARGAGLWSDSSSSVHHLRDLAGTGADLFSCRDR